ncbi:UNVERIFIED_CONTAM: hypothetical protein Slati_3100200 [Sesamum latifolium]|uniref:DUF4216 domain-containing protein n=1 Tax=Sesamum latifolium TaxID=2727402 RepID=A0AAW2UV19_9LAMI
MYHDFAEELHNIRLGLCTDDFAPHGQYGRTYSCCPVIITPYNLPPGMCMSFEYMFLMMVIPSPSNPKRLIDVYLEPLIEELLQLWHVGVRTGWRLDGVPPGLWDVRFVWMSQGHSICSTRSQADEEKHLLRSSLLVNASDPTQPWSKHLLEIGLFTSQHFKSGVQSKRTMPRRYDEHTNNDHGIQVSIFIYSGRASGAPKKRWLTGPERHIIKVHPMLNCTESELLKSHYWGPSAEVTSVPCYFVNEYNFQTEWHNTGKSTMNCVRGMKVHPGYHLIDVNFKKLYQKDEPFILAQQAVQVYFTLYPNLKSDKADWLVVAKVKARRVVDQSKWTKICTYQPDKVLPVPLVGTDNQTYDLRDPNGLQVMVDNQTTGTSRSQARQIDDDEDSFEDDETDDDEYELT